LPLLAVPRPFPDGDCGFAAAWYPLPGVTTNSLLLFVLLVFRKVLSQLFAFCFLSTDFQLFLLVSPLNRKTTGFHRRTQKQSNCFNSKVFTTN
jgi:hypothetical protein